MATTITTTNVARSLSKTIEAPLKFVDAALIFSLSTVSGEIEGDAPSLNVPYVDIPATADIVAEGEEIKEGDMSVSEMLVTTKKVAVLDVTSREILDDTNMQELITQNVMNAVVDKADAVFLQNTAAPVGLFNMEGIVDGGIMTDTLDPLVTAIGTVATNGASPSAIVMNYATWSKLLLFKTNGGSAQSIISPDVANNPTPVLFGLPVVLNKQAPNDKILLTDTREIISAVGQPLVASSADAYFNRDSIALRGTMRFGFGIIHPNRLAVLTVNTGK